MIDVLYEESAIDQNAISGAKKYNLLHTISMVVAMLAVIFLIWGIISIPINTENAQADALAAHKLLCFILFLQSGIFVAVWFGLTKWKSRYNVSYDYLFVSGELRISRVVGGRRHKLIANIDCQDIQQIGDADNASFPRLKADPSTKVVLCTPNTSPDEGKFFMYILASHAGKKLFVLECREILLQHMLKFLRHGILEDDYVMQYKKQQ